MFFVLKFELILIMAQIMCLRRAPEKYIAGAALDRAGLDCGVHNISQPYTPPRPVTGIALLFYLELSNLFVSYHWIITGKGRNIQPCQTNSGLHSG
jgi:hypothetical protein